MGRILPLLAAGLLALTLAACSEAAAKKSPPSEYEREFERYHSFPYNIDNG
ncbi:MAG: hypothetical protein ACLQJR_21780 [Stellaceae bacterium]